MYRELNIPNIFTMEASFCGADRGETKNQHFTIESLMMMGQKLLQAIIINWNIPVKSGASTLKREDLERELTANKQLLRLTSGDDEGNSSGSDSEPSADNMDDDEMSKIVPAVKPKAKPPPKKEEKKPAPKKIVAIVKKPQSPD